MADGGRDNILRVPADPPAKRFWSATVYAIATRCLIHNDQQRGDRGSRAPDLVTNDDALVDLYFGPVASASRTILGMASTSTATRVVSVVLLALRPEFPPLGPKATDGAIRATRPEAGLLVLT